jgi:hypothetical protein
MVTIKYILDVICRGYHGQRSAVPVNAPIYTPALMHMYSSPYPVQVQFPLPAPYAIIIPTTRNYAHGIIEEINVSIGFRLNAKIFVPLGLYLHTLFNIK